MDDEKRKILEKEIDLIQSCINRMAQNSFIVKGWTITLVTLSLLVSSETIIDIKFIGLILLVMTFCFWYLDGFFMKTEKLYRWKYEWVIKNRKCSDAYIYDLNPKNHDMWPTDDVGKYPKEPKVFFVMFSKILLPIYLILVILETALIIYFWLNK